MSASNVALYPSSTPEIQNPNNPNLTTAQRMDALVINALYDGTLQTIHHDEKESKEQAEEVKRKIENR